MSSVSELRKRLEEQAKKQSQSAQVVSKQSPLSSTPAPNHVKAAASTTMTNQVKAAASTTMTNQVKATSTTTTNQTINATSAPAPTSAPATTSPPQGSVLSRVKQITATWQAPPPSSNIKEETKVNKRTSPDSGNDSKAIKIQSEHVIEFLSPVEQEPCLDMMATDMQIPIISEEDFVIPVITDLEQMKTEPLIEPIEIEVVEELVPLVDEVQSIAIEPIIDIVTSEQTSAQETMMIEMIPLVSEILPTTSITETPDEVVTALQLRIKALEEKEAKRNELELLNASLTQQIEALSKENENLKRALKSSQELVNSLLEQPSSNPKPIESIPKQQQPTQVDFSKAVSQAKQKIVETTISSSSTSEYHYLFNTSSNQTSERIRNDYLPLANLEEIDRILDSKTTPYIAQKSIKNLADYLQKVEAPLPSSISDESKRLILRDIQKFRAVFRWVSRNITYDHKLRECTDATTVSAASTAENVLKVRRGISAGFCNFFKSLCDEMGLMVHTISGMAKGTTYQIGNVYKASDPPNHDWTRWDIQNESYLCDVTWDSILKNEFYWLTQPEPFAVTHLPQNPLDQLLFKPISCEQFSRMVYLRPEFFMYKLSLDHVCSSMDVIQKCSNRASWTFDAKKFSPPKPGLSCSIKRRSTGETLPENRTRFIQGDGLLTLLVHFPAVINPSDSEYEVHIFATQWLGAYLCRVDFPKGATELPPFPDFFSIAPYVIEPDYRSLKYESSVVFRLKLSDPPADVAIVDSMNQWYHLSPSQKDATLFEGSFTLNRKGKLHLYAKLNATSNASYTGIAVYYVE